MTPRTKRLVIVFTVAAVLLLANFLGLAYWLDGIGVVGWARCVEAKFFTGTAITVLLALLILIPPDRTFRLPHERTVRCWVCGHPVVEHARYCARCGSRVRRRGRRSSPRGRRRQSVRS